MHQTKLERGRGKPLVKPITGPRALPTHLNIAITALTRCQVVWGWQATCTVMKRVTWPQKRWRPGAEKHCWDKGGAWEISAIFLENGFKNFPIANCKFPLQILHMSGPKQGRQLRSGGGYPNLRRANLHSPTKDFVGECNLMEGGPVVVRQKSQIPPENKPKDSFER